MVSVKFVGFAESCGIVIEGGDGDFIADVVDVDDELNIVEFFGEIGRASCRERV